ncbi:hypothetical protein M0R45_001134 [Rubus argutus]|uniref:Uncharacterized protein n=1 Tax=Rubus argutus TaxID=59490 RepID=A0AAW1VNK1_RUBAR
MFKLSPRRNPRSKGFKVKHVLQICLLAGVCIWLVYQVKQSQVKKAQLAASIKDGDGIVKLGRKDLNPLREENVIEDARHKEEEEEEEKQECGRAKQA